MVGDFPPSPGLLGNQCSAVEAAHCSVGLQRRHARDAALRYAKLRLPYGKIFHFQYINIARILYFQKTRGCSCSGLLDYAGMLGLMIFPPK